MLVLQNNCFGGQLVSRTGYDEIDLVDYNAYSVKLNAGAYYKITNDIEASLLAIGVQVQQYIPVQTGML